jgi:propanediol dehydratase large subunit
VSLRNVVGFVSPGRYSRQTFAQKQRATVSELLKTASFIADAHIDRFQLMRQIDIMVNAKKVEWDSQLHVLQLQLDKKKKEAGILKIEVGSKMQEVRT